MTKKLQYIFLFLCLLTPFFSDSQTLNFNQFGIEDGLPQSGIYSMAQDKDGNIWIGTMAGVSKYNGISFENFTNRNGLAENRVIASCIDKNGNIWFGHWAGGISMYNYSQKRFVKIIPVGMYNYKSINCIYEDVRGMLWFGTNGQGALCLNPDQMNQANDTSARRDCVFDLIKQDDGLSSNVVNAICDDKDGNIWMGTEKGITIFKIVNQKIKLYTNYTNEEGLHSNTVTALLKDKKNRIWIGSNNSGVLRVTDFVKKDQVLYTTKNGLSSNDINTLFEDVSGNIFIGTFGGGVSKYLPELELNKYDGPIFQTISTRQGLSNDRVLSIIQDREKNIWIGTYLNLNQYFEEQFEIYGTHEGLFTSLVWSLLQDKKGDMWLGTDGGLVQFSRGKNANENRFTYYSYTSGNSKLKITATTALFEDKKGRIWYSNFGAGVTCLDPITKKTFELNEDNGLNSSEVFSITDDKDGNIWMGTNRAGVVKYDITTKKITSYTTKDGLGSNSIYYVYRDKIDRLWLGSLGGPLTVYDGNTFKNYGEEDGYKNKFTVSITEDKEGNLWLGSYENGFYKFNGKEFTNYTTKDGASSNTPLLMICDEYDNLWVGSNRGIDKFNMKSGKFKHYGKQDGFLGVEINPNAACKDKDGNLWFGAIIGAVKYNGAKERINGVEPVTFLKNPRLFFNEVDMPKGNKFAYNQNHFTFDFIGASLTNPKRVMYKHMLEGLDNEYSPPTKETHVTYQNLEPGHYTFKVIASNNDGLWNEKPETFTFTVLPPWWKTWWFYLLSAIVVITSIYVFFKYREQALKERNRELEEKVTERTYELRLEKETVEKQNVKIEIQNKNITDSIDYAQRIQAAILPSTNLINTALAQNFVLYKPKQIVSGDFYWILPHGVNGEVLFATADCTGHGVPGAFMSIVCYNVLKQVTSDFPGLMPAQILTKVDKELAKVLNKTEGSLGSLKGEVLDAMDIALCSINLSKGEIVYSGARSNLYHVRNGVLKEMTPSKKSVGIIPDEKSQPYDNQILKVEKGDMLYFFTDGFPDQKGGDRGKKFYYEPFRNLLIDVSTKPCDEQKRILNETIISWRGQHDQTDDITVIGIKV